ncbi:hypothetical protein HK099_003185 [Clydaea vesicula]|uniref:FAD synthase n=1 Tax=Clydaea vesicula TaxID=447962 RepID=A0AAD5U1V8_9FUNG|nr:hypothetical protein HK099_003185 [Clydaea vesicula]KAJ3385437.1 hypothetical protein HDU92_003078 [Lobulomyces angularis]
MIKLNASIEAIKKSIKDYGIESLVLSFNGGKDCTVLLHLFFEVLCQLNANNDSVLKINTLYVASPNPFSEVTEFVNYCKKRYDLRLFQYETQMKQALQIFLDSASQVQAILIGQRRSDPYSSHLTTFIKTDNGWPEIMRVHPILDWEYDEIWEYLLENGLPYCTLYDQGFTSLGSKNNTMQTLCLQNKDRFCGYDPAYLLKDFSKEREGRLDNVHS